MNIVEKLMKFDAGKLAMPTGEVKIRLKKLGGEEFVFPIQALTPALVGEISDEVMDITMRKGKTAKMNLAQFRAQLRTIVEGCPEVFKNSELQSRFGAKTPYELVEKLMLSGEMDILSDAIDALSGYGDNKEIGEDEVLDESDQIKN